METNVQQILTRRQQGLRPGRSRRAAGLQVLVAVLMLLVAGVTPAWARDKHFTWDHTNVSDGSGSTYTGTATLIEGEYVAATGLKLTASH